VRGIYLVCFSLTVMFMHLLMYPVFLVTGISMSCCTCQYLLFPSVMHLAVNYHLQAAFVNPQIFVKVTKL
jgi:hypothetical protein